MKKHQTLPEEATLTAQHTTRLFQFLRYEDYTSIQIKITLPRNSLVWYDRVLNLLFFWVAPLKQK